MKTNISLLPEEIQNKILYTVDTTEIIKTKSCDFTISKNNVLIYSQYNPIKETKRNISKYNITIDSIIFLFGFGLGYNLTEIFDNYKWKNIFIIDYNYDILNKAFEYFDYSSYLKHNNIHFLNTENETALIDTISDNLQISDIKNCIFIKNTRLLQFNPEKFSHIIKLINKIINFKIISFNTNSLFKEEWITHTFTNILKLNKTLDFNDLSGKLKNLPIIIIGAGPSLNNHINEIKKLQGKVLIAAVDTAVKILIDSDIIPDIIAIADSQKINYDLIKNCDIKDSLVLTNLIAFPDLFDKKNNNFLVYNSGTPLLSEIENKFQIRFPELKTGGSVTTLILSFSIFCGCNPIIFDGMDLSFPNLQFYSKGTQKDENIFKNISKFNTPEIYYYNNFINNTYIFENDINEDKVLTTNVLKGFRDWIIYETKKYTDISFINVSEQGILTKPIIQDTLQNIQKYAETKYLYTKKIIGYCKPFNINKSEIINYYKFLLSGFEKIKSESEQILVIFKTLQNITGTFEIQLNSFIKYYNDHFLKIYIDFYIQNYLLLKNNYRKNNIDYYQQLITVINDALEFYINLLKNIL